jgi:PAS domain S-box-containing protein
VERTVQTQQQRKLMENNEKEIRELRRLLRDLVALATTPAIWVGRERAQIAEGVADVLLHTLRADAVYVCLQSPNKIEAIRSPQHSGFYDEVRRVWQQAATASLYVDTITAPNWPIALRVAIQPIGFSADDGFIAVGCAGCEFPNEAESLLLSVAANQTTVALQSARLRLELQNTFIASQRLAAIVESSDDAIVSKDLNGIVTSWNPAAERIFGYTAQEMIGRPITTIIPPELLDDETRILATIARGERIEHFETVRIRKGGERLDISLTISPVRNDAGQIIGAAKIARDITHQKKTERALHTTERLAAVGRLAATVAHEINNPLAAVINFVYLSKQRTVSDDVRRFLSGAQEELTRISHLTKQTLGFYRETQGASCMTLGPTLDPLISVFSYKTRNKAIKIHSEIREDPQIYAVPGEIRQLVANLLSNSIDAVGMAGKIRIRVSGGSSWNGSQKAGVRLTIADSGAGIPSQARSKLFEPFFTTKKDIGTGLGLWICRNIVEKHHGRIRVKTSTVPGRSWTAFTVFLPSSSQALTTTETLRTA